MNISPYSPAYLFTANLTHPQIWALPYLNSTFF